MVSTFTHTKIPKPEWFSEPAFISEAASVIPSIAFHSVGWFSENTNPHVVIGEFLFTRPDRERLLASHLAIDDRDWTPRSLSITNMLQRAAEYIEGEASA